MKNFMNEILDKTEPGGFDDKGLIRKIESGYEAENGVDFKTKKTFGPSTLVYGNGACPRYWYLAFDGADFVSENDSYSHANMRSGIHGHERIQKAITDAGIMVEEEKRVVSQDPPIFGFADAVIQWGDDQPVVEIKTMREESFAYRKTGKAPYYHVAQLLIYMRVLGKKLGILLYESKNSHELVAKPIEWTEERSNWVDYAFDWMRKVRKAWEDRTIPVKTYRSNSKVCKTCPVAATCALADKGEVRIEPLEYLK